MLEDYYGFSSDGTNMIALKSQRSVQRTERSPRLMVRNARSPPTRTLKRT
jgi:hypothetical protein